MGERETAGLSEFMRFLAKENADGGRLPSLAVLSQQLGVSVATLREQLEVARALGLVEVRPKTGIRRLPYTFSPAVLHSLSYAASIDPSFFFTCYSDLRTHVEAAYWGQAVALLKEEDHTLLRSLIERAEEKLRGHPVQIPHDEHRNLHLSIFSRLDNPFVIGILEAYWDAYEAVGLDLYTDLSYLRTVWRYHRWMVEAICTGDYEAGYRALIEHTDLLQQRAQSNGRKSVSHTALE
jgi:DNA-binding FadR family transcriptional regulator